ncbi:bifunctional transcriptional activator/DNA repair enzyme AdaA [Blastopirellula marina]|uniref:methylated-DNA--[protein]-cysteine S-methyltransferase n=1 Tax=Blastopirellula marina TaxID=124 RepID=A0A2S8F946_9BACT|nr:bifunctional transcriptional activator/DNA repair protein Ada [Blastopirellula marina]PQO28686.1 XRE family transcriptional regulator [Blastopirellula marina]PTL41959.1 XRE family transcriptional regulator [Blastopirellula marina]
MYQAIVRRDATMEGVFFVAVKTTGIFCRPGCKAKTPKRENVEFFATSAEAIAAGYRACRRCHPLELSGTVPAWLENLLSRIETEPNRRWTNADLTSLGLSPSRVRRWFQEHYQMTFHAYLRTQRLGLAVERLRSGSDVTSTALDSGFESLSGFRESLRKWVGETPTNAKQTEPILTARILTPLGPMLAAGGDSGLCLLEFADRKMLAKQFQRISKLFAQPILIGSHRVLDQTDQQVQQYFAGERTSFDLPLRIDGTPFQTAVWTQLRAIPYGQTNSYQQLAKRLGKPTASRAVGRTNGDNRFAIVIPCHRVVRSDGHLCGYAGGLWRKKWLLNWERQNSPSERQHRLPLPVE